MTSMRVGLDSFSFHRWFGETNEWERPVGEHWTTDDLWSYVAGLEIDVLSLQTAYLPELTFEVSQGLRSDAARAGVELVLAWGHRSGLQDGRSPEKLKEALATLDAAAEMGCPIVRIVCGDQGSWSEDRSVRADNMERLRAPLGAIASRAEELGLHVAVENHADRPTEELFTLVSAIGSNRLGLCFDVANAARVGDDPVEAACSAAPMTFMAQLRDLPLSGYPRRGPGDWWPCVALGRGDLDIPSVLRALIAGGQCRAWFVEASNVMPGDDERDMVAASLSYLKSFIAQAGS
jgi:sugar phosphate isomerase/epimerase